MVGTLTLSAPQMVIATSPFACGIVVSGASPSTNVTVQLDQTHGLAPMWAGSSVVIAVGPTGSGGGTIPGIALNGPTPIAVLVATATSTTGDVFTPAAVGIKVI